jgi:NADH-quinone oxidoreductase subunit D
VPVDDPVIVSAGIADEWVDHPEGDVGCLVVSDGGPRPWRVHFRVPSIAARAAVPLALADADVSAVDVVLATLPLAAGEADR